MGLRTPAENRKSSSLRHGCFAFGLIAVRLPVLTRDVLAITLGQHPSIQHPAQNIMEP